jgi:hypothetical protein
MDYRCFQVGARIKRVFIHPLKPMFMAHLAQNTPLQGLSGRVGNLIFKFYPHLNNGKGRTVVSKLPDMSGITASPRQEVRRGVFGEAVAYAKGVIRDPEKRAAYQEVLKPGQSVFNAALSNYMKRQQEEMNAKGED